ncbi:MULTISPECIES: capsular polysaccharide biosynthesis protein [unclassified Leisingera]|uniref:capsular polysaccharide biosynthesis protein n=1 Tax=unclassified Leisingera TaxID=2614906 RepID=UPI000319D8F4|nr:MULTISPECIES: capsular polysaccharide biosynthesis protein [unclassified Leisingera]KIC26023.1 capsular biosynthesis protein [Leisingera sp. ANG-S3]KIC53249.1 capsular biosynthesis protein [Leisingera sp. ANG-S]KID08301.1 capsular biosynthesis protein [Leisingera sp. ANG1]
MHLTAGRQEAGSSASRLFVYNGGFLTQRRVRRILELSGYSIRLGLPQPEDLVGIWGASPTAHRGLAVAAKRGCGMLRVEDAFLRSLHPGRAGEPPAGLMLDRSGVHFDAAEPSDLEQLLAAHPLDDAHLMQRARDAIARLKSAHLSKYNAFDPSASVPEPGYVLVADQARDDASVTASRADRARFLEMLAFAQEEHPGARVLIKTHPETLRGYRAGYYDADDANGRVQLFTGSVSPWALLDGAIGVYTVSSQLGFEAILAGHKPRVFGQPFYAGWGLSIDDNAPSRRRRQLTRAQLFAAAMILYPKWHDPFRDELCELETVLDNLEAKARAWRQDHQGWAASGMRLWKRKPLQKFFGAEKRVLFTEDPAEVQASGRKQMVWAGKAQEVNAGAVRVEDGFLRSRGLGAELVPPLSLVTDRQGIYYDPRQPSDLDALIARRVEMTQAEERRAERLVQSLIRDGVSKYNLGGGTPALPEGRRILVPGQVEDDASILCGADEVRTNLDLLRSVRAANPEAVIIYKPHPDVEAGLRKGQVAAEELADVVASQADPMALLSNVQEVWTITSLLGFEALLRGVKVTTLGTPFYAGWGLTTDLAPVPSWRQAQVPLMGLAHAALIDYPRYFDPVTGQPCPAEVAVMRLREGHLPHPGLSNRLLSKLQGLFATYAHLWR